MATVKKVKKAQRGGCVSNMSSQERTNFFRGGTEGQLRRAGNKQMRENARAERKEERVEKRAAKKAAKSAPEAKAGKTIKKAQRGGCVSNMTGAQRQRYFQGGPSPLQKAGQAIKNVLTGGKTKEERQEARAERKAARAAKKAPAAKSGKTVSMQLGSYGRQPGKNYSGKAKMGKSMSKCKYGC
jgi:hypothetical protein